MSKNNQDANTNTRVGKKIRMTLEQASKLTGRTNFAKLLAEQQKELAAGVKSARLSKV